MRQLIDIVNLNSKASCLSSERWLKALEGGSQSELYQLLMLYVKAGAKVNLGIIGTTLADIKEFNPECIELINAHPECFEMIHRPYVHSLSIFWSDVVFAQNVRQGKALIEKEFKRIYPAYLPPEFVLRNSQLVRLKKEGIGLTFIHPNRVKKDVMKNFPQDKFCIQTIQQEEMNCAVFDPNYDAYYLDCIQKLSSEQLAGSSQLVYGWRDGESPFLIPDGVEREAHFVAQSSKQFKRYFLSEVMESSSFEQKVNAYPQNSLLPWFSNFRLLWYINEVKLLESGLQDLSPLKSALFLLLLNSDILSSTEKNHVQVSLRTLEPPIQHNSYEIKRQNRNLEAEELMYLIENCTDQEILAYIDAHDSAFIRLLKAELKPLYQA